MTKPHFQRPRSPANFVETSCLEIPLPVHQPDSSCPRCTAKEKAKGGFEKVLGRKPGQDFGKGNVRFRSARGDAARRGSLPFGLIGRQWLGPSGCSRGYAHTQARKPIDVACLCLLLHSRLPRTCCNYFAAVSRSAQVSR